MANEALDSFLASETQGTPEPAAPPTPSAPPEAPPAAPKPTPEPTPQRDPKPPEDDPDPPQPLEGEPVIGRRAYEDERRKRQDWKAEAIREKERRESLERQIEEAKRQPPPQQPLYQPPAAPDPNTDPIGYVQWQAMEHRKEMLNERLNNSEERLREKIGDEKLNEYVAEFKQLAHRDQTLFGKLYSQTNPYGWMTREVDRQRTLRDVGDDPAAYRARIEAEARAKWEAEAASRPPPPSPAAGLQPSLATARSVAGRTATTWTGEPSLEDVLAPVQNRKSQNGQMRRF